MPDVKFSNLYPYTDFHELNLDWVIKEVKFWSERVGKSIQKIELTGTVGLVDTYTITYSDSTTSTFDVTNGNGIASVAKTGTVGLVDTYTITFQDGSTTTFEIHNGTSSIDPTLTLSDYAADAKVTGDYIRAISTAGFLPMSLNWTDNYYIYSVNGNFNSLNTFRYSDVIQLKVGEKIMLRNFRSSTASVVAVVARYTSQGVFIDCPYAYPAAGDLPDYEYTATDDFEYVRVCTQKTDNSPWVGYQPVSLEMITNRVIELEKYNITPNGYTTPTLTLNNGQYINFQGNINSLSGYTYSDNVEFNPGDVVIVGSEDISGGAVSRISEWTAGGTYIRTISLGTTTYTEFTYVVDHHCYLRFSYRIASGIEIKTTSINIPESVIYAVKSNTHQNEYFNASMFESIGYCGDSYVIGQIYNGGGVIGDKPSLAWGSVVGRLLGNDTYFYASSGANTALWQTRADCLPALLADDPRGLYVFCLGINDSSTITTGTLADIHPDYHDNPNTYYGNFGRILAQVMAHATDSKIILMNPMHPLYNAEYVTPLTEIAQYFGVQFINTQNSAVVMNPLFRSQLVGGHPTAAQHSALAEDFILMSSAAIANNYDYFKTYYGVS